MDSLQEAEGVLKRERDLAESGAGLLKVYARDDAGARSRGQLLYDQAKAASDELIDRLLLAVRNNDDPGRSPALRSLMSEALERRSSLTKHVENSLPRSQGTRSAAIAAWLDLLEPTKIAADMMVPLLIEAGVTVWKLWRERGALQREGILARLTAQKWRAFVDVPEAQ